MCLLSPILLGLSPPIQIGKADRVGDLYCFKSFKSSDSVSFPSVAAINNSTVSNKEYLWHVRLGHSSLQVREEQPDCLVFSPSSVRHFNCNICHLAKQKRLSFPSNPHKVDNIFDLIHIDIWGPFHIHSVEGFRYFLTIVDDKSRYTWAYFLKAKSDVREVLPNYFSMVATQYGIQIKGVRSDNAPELQFRDFFAAQGVVHYFSCVERPQQNSVVERKHQHILNVARALIFQSGIDLKFWPDAVFTSIHLINRLPSVLLQHQTPYHVLHSRAPSYAHLRVFGCLCYGSTLMSDRHKFSPRSRACVLLGYPVGMKAYKLLDVEDGQVFFSRDVIFYETIFPFAHKLTPDQVHGIFPDAILPACSQDSTILPSSDIVHPDCPMDMPVDRSVAEHVATTSADEQAVTTSTDAQDTTSSHLTVTRSRRAIKPPSYLRDFHCGSVSATCGSSRFPLSRFVSYHRLSPSFKAAVLSIGTISEPTTYSQACGQPAWESAMKEELDALVANHTWCIVDLPLGVKPIGCKWVYKLKYNADGTIASETRHVWWQKVMPNKKVSISLILLHRLRSLLPSSFCLPWPPSTIGLFINSTLIMPF
ncbi:hypothetical protein Dimus_037799 [Dionaea muscipula]